MKILIDAVYLNSDGGIELLDILIESTHKNFKKLDILYLLDSRNTFFNKKIKYRVCKPTIKDRKFFYKENIKEFDKIICLANIPPPIKIANKSVTILFHNSLLLEWCSSINLINNSKNLLKRLIIYLSGNRNYNWVVQTELMKKKLSKSVFVSRSKIRVFPFFRNISLNTKNTKNDMVTRFLYVTSNSPHKKNEILIKAFKKAKFNTNIKTKLSLTLNGKNSSSKNKKIIFLGKLSKDEINKEYLNTDFLIYPSVSESFGLPLVESTFFPIKILASNSEYVNYVVKPSLTFDSNSIDSIQETIEKVVNLNKIVDSKLIINNELESFIKFIYSNV